jgi:hypothetical protein
MVLELNTLSWNQWRVNNAVFMTHDFVMSSLRGNRM